MYDSYTFTSLKEYYKGIIIQFVEYCEGYTVEIGLPITIIDKGEDFVIFQITYHRYLFEAHQSVSGTRVSFQTYSLYDYNFKNGTPRKESCSSLTVNYSIENGKKHLKFGSEEEPITTNFEFVPDYINRVINYTETLVDY